MKKFVIMAALVAATASLAMPSRAQEAPLPGQTPGNVDPPITVEPYNASGDSGYQATDSTANSYADSSASTGDNDSNTNACGDPCANTQTTIDVGDGNPIVGKTEVKSQNVYNSYTKKVIVNKPTERMTLTRVVNGRTRVVHLYRPVNEEQAKAAAIAALRELNVVNQTQLHVALYAMANNVIFSELYNKWGIASKSFVDWRIAKAIAPIYYQLNALEGGVKTANVNANDAKRDANDALQTVTVVKNKQDQGEFSWSIFGCLVVICMVVLGGIFSSRR